MVDLGGAVRAAVERLGLEWISLGQGAVERALVRRPGVEERQYTCQVALWQGESGELEGAIEGGSAVAHRILRMDLGEFVEQVLEGLRHVSEGRAREYFHEKLDGTLETAGWDIGLASVRFRCPDQHTGCTIHGTHAALSKPLPAWRIPFAGDGVS